MTKLIIPLLILVSTIHSSAFAGGDYSQCQPSLGVNRQGFGFNKDGRVEIFKDGRRNVKKYDLNAKMPWVNYSYEVGQKVEYDRATGNARILPGTEKTATEYFVYDKQRPAAEVDIDGLYANKEQNISETEFSYNSKGNCSPAKYIRFLRDSAGHISNVIVTGDKELCGKLLTAHSKSNSTKALADITSAYIESLKDFQVYSPPNQTPVKTTAKLAASIFNEGPKGSLFTSKEIDPRNSNDVIALLQECEFLQQMSYFSGDADEPDVPPQSDEPKSGI